MEKFSFLALAALVLVASHSASAQTLNSTYYQEPCYWGTCQSRLSFVPKGRPSLQEIADRFGVEFSELMGANNLDIRDGPTLRTSRVTSGTILIPVFCECLEQAPNSQFKVRRTNRTVYTVQPGDTLSVIAEDLYGGLTTFPVIAAANAISDPNKIFPGQNLTIPILCSCPNFGEQNPKPFTIGLTYTVAKGDDLSIIASKFGTNSSSIQSLNNITNPASLKVAQLIRVPMPACQANFSGGATDRDIIATKGAYNLTTPEDCVQCYCLGEPTPSLQCVPNPARNATLCPSLDCSTNLQIGNLTTKVNAEGQCEVVSCSYGGYLSQGRVDKPILQYVQPTCPPYPTVPAPSTLGTIPGGSPPVPGAPPGTPGGPPGNSSAITTGPHHLLITAATVAVAVLLSR